MKNITRYTLLLALSGMLFTLASCDEEPTDALKEIIKDDLGYVPRISAFTLVSPASTSLPAGTDITLDVRYWSEGTIKDIQFWMVMGEDETKIGEVPYTSAYSEVTRTDSLRFAYQIPSFDAGTEFSIQARVTNTGLEEYPTKSALIKFKLE